MKLHNVYSCIPLIVSIFCFGLIHKVYANVADDLNANYNKIVNDCGSPRKPAFLCSGIMIRVTSTSHDYHTWDPSPNSISRQGISFVYLRKDIKAHIDYVGKTSGIIYFPGLMQPSWKGLAEIKCAFPIDGWTSTRSDSCGNDSLYPDGSNSCQSQDINTADAWYNHFVSIPDEENKRGQHQCGFNMSIGTQNTADAFNENLKAIRKMQSSRAFYEYNEIIIKTWPTIEGKIPNPEALPIQAFFYRDNGLVDAQYFQYDYYNVTNIWIPIVKMVQDTEGGNTKFYYDSHDQLIAGCSK